MAPVGVEPTTLRFEDARSNHLSYGANLAVYGGSPRDRTGLGLPPAELQSAASPLRRDSRNNGRGDRIRTYDIQYPKLARYLTALHPDGVS